jgi:MFS family permease
MKDNAGAVRRHAIDSPYAWRMIPLAFVTLFVIFGVVYSFGAFFKPIAAEFRADRARTSALFAVTAAIYNALGLAGGRLMDRFGPRRVMLVGACALGAGLIVAGSARTLPVACVGYGLGVGVGVGCTYVPALALVGGWFARRRNTAMGIAVSGTGAGTLVVAPMAAALIRGYGWRESYVLIGMASALLVAACAWFAEAPPRRATITPRPVTHLLRSADFVPLYIAMLLVSVSIYIPFVYLPDFAESRGFTDVAAAALVGFIGAASIVGRLAMGPIADRAGIFPLYKASLLVLAASFAIWPLAHSYPILVLFAIVMGAAYGGMVSLTPTVVAELYGVEDLGTTLGALYTSSAVSALAGPPLVGYAIDHGGTYLWAAVLGGAAGLIGFGVLLPVRPAAALAPTLIHAK